METNAKGLALKGIGTLVQGFVFGVGFALAAWGIYFLAYNSLMSQAMTSVQDYYSAITGSGQSAAAIRKDVILSSEGEKKMAVCRSSEN